MNPDTYAKLAQGTAPDPLRGPRDDPQDDPLPDDDDRPPSPIEDPDPADTRVGRAGVGP